jgi:hypothetical protein
VGKGSFKESFSEYAPAISKQWWGYIAMWASIVAMGVGVIGFIVWANNTKPPLPLWNIILIAGGAVFFIIVNFLTFHRVRVEREKKIQELLVSEQKNIELQGQIQQLSEKVEQLTKQIPTHQYPLEIVNKDQGKHREEIEQYLQNFKASFPEIAVTWGTFQCNIKGEGQLKWHLDDTVFWQTVDIYKDNVSQANFIHDQLFHEILLKTNQIAPLESMFDSQKQHVFLIFTHSIIALCVGGEWSNTDYIWEEDTQSQRFGGIVISHGVKSENEHRELIELYKKDERCIKLKSIAEKLIEDRIAILNKIDSIGYNRYALCPDCPLVTSGYAKL